MSIPFYNFHDLHNTDFKSQIMARFEKIVNDNSFIEGEYNNSFEKRFAKLQNSKHCLLVANGTDAIEISLLAYGIRPGDKVGIPGITYYATAEAVININAVPILIDVDEDSYLICPKSLKNILEKHNLKAIIPVHIYGLPAPILELEKICKQSDIKIIEDAAQAQGTFVSGKPVGSFNSLTTFSFYPTKNLSAFGDAGCILTQDDELARKIKTIRNHGRDDENSLGRNSRCDHMQAAVLDLKLDNVDMLNEKRKLVAKNYHTALNSISEIELLENKFLNESSWHLYPIKLKNTEKRILLQAHLKSLNISTAPFYERALSQEPPLADCQGEKETSEALAGRILCLPINPFITEQDVKNVSEAIRKFL